MDHGLSTPFDGYDRPLFSRAAATVGLDDTRTPVA